MCSRVTITIGCPSTQDFIKQIEQKGLQNCPGTSTDVKVAEMIFWSDIGSLKGKTTHQQPPVVESPITSVSRSILKPYQAIVLCVDIMDANQQPMLVSISHNFKFGTVEAIQNKKSDTIIHLIKSILQVYKRSGFVMTTALMDGRFGHLWGELAELAIKE